MGDNPGNSPQYLESTDSRLLLRADRLLAQECRTRELQPFTFQAVYIRGVFTFQTFYCPLHEVRAEMRVHRLDALRRLYIQREENQLLAKIFNHSYSSEMAMRVGSLIFHKIGQLLPEQLKTFHNEEHIFPIGYRITRLFWSASNAHECTRYVCSIDDRENSPEFCVAFESRELRDRSPGWFFWKTAHYALEKPLANAWNRILLSIQQMREKAATGLLKFFPNHLSGEVLFGFVESAITKMLESLPGVDLLFTYNFKHGGTPLMDLPLAVRLFEDFKCLFKE